MKVVYGKREIFRNKGYAELCVVSIQEVSNRRSTDDSAKRSGIKIEKNWGENEALGNSAGKIGMKEKCVKGSLWQMYRMRDINEPL